MPFELSGEDGVFKPAVLVNVDGFGQKPAPYKTKGIVKGGELVLKAEGVASPKKVRYLYEKPWIGNVFAASGLPLGPFEASFDEIAK